MSLSPSPAPRRLRFILNTFYSGPQAWFFLADDRGCPTALPLPDAAADRLRTVLRLVNSDLAEVARKQKVDFIDMYAASPGHELCSNDPWMAGERNVPGKALQFHPYTSYHRAVADKILALLKK